MIAFRNIAIVALLALAVTVLPGGGNVAEAVIVTLSLLFVAAIGLLAARGWEQTRFARDAMTDRQRALIYSALGAIALMIAGADELLGSGVGALVWFAVLGGSGWLIYSTWREANAY